MVGVVELESGKSGVGLKTQESVCGVFSYIYLYVYTHTYREIEE